MAAEWERRMDQWERRMDRLERFFEVSHRQAMERMDRAEARMDKMDKQIQAMRNVVQGGIKFVTKMAADNKKANDETRAMLNAWLRKNSNGDSNGHSKRGGK